MTGEPSTIPTVDPAFIAEVKQPAEEADGVPTWLNLDALISDQLIADLATARAEAEALAPAVRELAILSYRATSAFESALARANLPDEVWETAKDACGAEATFEALRRLIDDLQIARLEKASLDPPEWFEQERAGANR